MIPQGFPSCHNSAMRRLGFALSTKQEQPWIDSRDEFCALKSAKRALPIQTSQAESSVAAEAHDRQELEMRGAKNIPQRPTGK